MIHIEKTPDWHKQGLCWGRPDLTALFFPPNDETTQDARQYCDRCPVKIECRDYAITNEIHWGIWGGLSPRQREWYRRNPVKFGLRPISCEECDTPLSGRQRLFCSIICVRKASRRRVRRGQSFPVPCRQCGKEFLRRTPSQILCGAECRRESANDRVRQRRTTPSTIGCWTCGAQIEQSTTKKYCSDACRAKARRERNRIA